MSWTDRQPESEAASPDELYGERYLQPHAALYIDHLHPEPKLPLGNWMDTRYGQGMASGTVSQPPEPARPWRGTPGKGDPEQRYPAGGGHHLDDRSASGLLHTAVRG